jgi:signal peptidase I
MGLAKFAVRSAGIVSWIFLLAVAGLAIVISGGRTMGWQLLSVQSNSMTPTFQAGDGLLVKRGQKLKPGDIVSYRRPDEPDVVISHRLINLKNGWLTTQGDAAKAEDPPVPISLVVGRAQAVTPGLGRVLDTTHRPLILSSLLTFCTSFIVIEEINKLRQVFRQPRYRLYPTD